MLANASANDNKLKILFKVSGFNKETREVTGIATSETVDSHDEILTYDGSKAAVKSWVGNIREMHQPKAVGKRVAVKCDDKNKQIIVKSYVSKGAEDTWQKVLDGTLSYYSVGGERVTSEIKAAKDLSPEVFKGMDQIPDEVRVTTKWRMTELSLVDSGANPDCSIELVKDVNGKPVQTEAIEDEAAEPVKKDTPKSAFAYIDKEGKGHYQVKEDGQFDFNLTRFALTRAEAEIKSGGDKADLAKKALPKIRASAKKIQVEQFKDNPSKFLALHDVTAIKLDDGTSAGGEGPIDKDQLVSFAGFLKYGSYAMSFSCTPVDFDTAYQRYQADQAIDEVYDLVSVFSSCVLAAVFDPDMSQEDKNNLVAKSTQQFVVIFTEAASEAAMTRVQSLEDLRKAFEEALVGVEVKKENETVTAAAIQAMISNVLSAETLGKAVAGAIKPISDNVEGLNKTVTEKFAAIETRLAKVEETPVTRNAPVIKTTDRSGRVETFAKNGTGISAPASIRKSEAGELVLEENGVEYTLPEVQAKITTLEGVLKTMPAADPNRLRNEVECIALMRIRKILSGDKVWR